MTPTDLDLITDDVAAIDPDALAADFYRTLFELAPAARALFPPDLAEQRRKLMTELSTMIDFATSSTAGDMQRFVERAHRLGARHVRYGATPAHYELVGAALLAALGRAVDGWDDTHRSAWAHLYGVVAETMLEGAAQLPG